MHSLKLLFGLIAIYSQFLLVIRVEVWKKTGWHAHKEKLENSCGQWFQCMISRFIPVLAEVTKKDDSPAVSTVAWDFGDLCSVSILQQASWTTLGQSLRPQHQTHISLLPGDCPKPHTRGKSGIRHPSLLWYVRCMGPRKRVQKEPNFVAQWWGCSTGWLDSWVLVPAPDAVLAFHSG